MKNGFILYHDYEEHFELLSDEELGMLIRAIYKYEKTGEVPELVGLPKMAFSFIKSNLDILRDKYEKQVEKNKENGAKGGRPKKANKSKAKQSNKDEEITNPIEPKVTGGFSDEPKKNFTDIDINKEMDKEDKTSSNEPCIYKQVIDYLNLKGKFNYKHTSKGARAKIKARLNEGYKLGDFIVVIDKKCEKWLKDEKMISFLRPTTLFGTKFEEYLNERVLPISTQTKKSKFVNYDQRTRDYDELERLAHERLMQEAESDRESDNLKLQWG